MSLWGGGFCALLISRPYPTSLAWMRKTIKALSTPERRDLVPWYPWLYGMSFLGEPSKQHGTQVAKRRRLRPVCGWAQQTSQRFSHNLKEETRYSWPSEQLNYDSIRLEEALWIRQKDKVHRLVTKEHVEIADVSSKGLHRMIKMRHIQLIYMSKWTWDDWGQSVFFHQHPGTAMAS